MTKVGGREESQAKGRKGKNKDGREERRQKVEGGGKEWGRKVGEEEWGRKMEREEWGKRVGGEEWKKRMKGRERKRERKEKKD